MEDFVFSTTDLTDVPQYVTRMWNTYDQTPHNDRFCPVCNSVIIEDEFHFLLHCPKYSIPREKFYNQIQHYFVDFNQLSSTQLLIKLMNSQNFSLNSHLSKFVSLCNDSRNNLLSNHTDDTWLTIVIIAFIVISVNCNFKLAILYLHIVMQIKLMLLLLLASGVFLTHIWVWIMHSCHEVC